MNNKIMNFKIMNNKKILCLQELKDASTSQH